MNLLLLSFLMLLSSFTYSRSYHSLNDDWLFNKLDQNKSEFTSVDLPYSFNSQDADDGDKYFRGAAIFKKEFTNPCGRNDSVYIEVSNANSQAKIELNNNFVGVHEGGYTRFRFLLPPTYLQLKTNELVIRVDNSETNYIAPLGGDFSVMGGINGDVNLVCVKSFSFDLGDYGADGIYITPSLESPVKADVDLKIRLTNREANNRSAKVIMKIRDPQGKIVYSEKIPVVISGNKTEEIQHKFSIKNPQLWHGVDDPALYAAEFSLHSRFRVVDKLRINFGIRKIEIASNQGLKLNGKPYRAYGVNLHLSQRPGKGTAVTKEEQVEDFNMLDELGLTALRLAHYPHPKAILDHADKQGYLVWSEVPLVSLLNATPRFRENIKTQLKEMIKQQYNHPSVFVWGLGNEIYNANDEANLVIKELHQVAKAEDALRYTVYANCCGPVTQSIAMHTDLNASNIYHGWYPQQTGTMSDWLDDAISTLKTINRSLAVSEYGAGASINHQEDPPSRPVTDSSWHPEQYQSLVHEISWRAIKSKPDLWASFIWVAFDFASDGRNEGDRAGINDKGLITYDRKVKKDAFYWYKANWSSEPLIYITSRRFLERKNETVDLKVYSNQDELQLYVNDQLVSVVEVKDRIASWKIGLKPGVNSILVKTPDGSVSDFVQWKFIRN